MFRSGRGETGRRAGFRFPWPQGLAGSSPVARIAKPADPKVSAGVRIRIGGPNSGADQFVVRAGEDHEIGVVGLGIKVDIAVE